jgi:hypothetical protein
LKHPELLKPKHFGMLGGEDRNKYKGKKSKLSFDELLPKYLKENEAKRANRSNDGKS